MRMRPLLLLVDDDKDFGEIMTTQLKAGGFDVEVARTQEEAIAKAQSVSPDLVLMDIFLSSSVRGTDVAFLLKQDPKTQNLKIAFLSSMKDPWPGIVGEKRDVSRDLGMEDFIDKTEDLNAITEKIRKVLARPAAAPPVISAAPVISSVPAVSPTTSNSPAAIISPIVEMAPPPPPPR